MKYLHGALHPLVGAGPSTDRRENSSETNGSAEQTLAICEER